jgi:hypothetical protein
MTYLWWLAILMNPRSWRGPWQSYPKYPQIDEEWITVKPISVRVSRNSA